MADATKVVVCDVLCYLRHKFVKTPLKVLKSVLMDFYSAEVLSCAKKQLLDDISAIDTTVKFPHVPQRRDGDNRIVNEVDDIMALFIVLDENILLDELPRYVADGPDNMPATRLYEGDLAMVMNVMDKMDRQIQELNDKLVTILVDINSLQRASTGATVTGRAAGPPHQRSTVNNFSEAGRENLTLGNPMQATTSVTADRSAGVQRLVPSTAVGNMAASGSEQASGFMQPTVPDWAATVSSSPYSQGNRFAVLAVDDDGGNPAAANEEPFVVYERRQTKRLRQRSSPATADSSPLPPPATMLRLQSPQQHQRRQQQSQRQQTQPQQQQQQRPARRRGVQLMRGNSASIVQGVAAAKKLVTKAVFCVDNLAPTVSPEGLSQFVRKLSVDVLSCFKAQPRRRPNEPRPVVDRAAFRLCIDATHRDRLLDASLWPESVTISEWYRINPSRDGRQQTRGTQEHLAYGSEQASGVAAIAVSATPATASAASDSETDSDTAAEMETTETTITYHDGAISVSS